MAKARAIKKRIKAVKNTRKITKTMGMVATAKSKRAVDNLRKAEKYKNSIVELFSTLIRSGEEDLLKHPLMLRRDKEENIDLLIITANRGLCGGYNTNIIKLATKYMDEFSDKNIRLFVVGKKGISYFNFKGIPLEGKFTHIEDKPTYKDARDFANIFIDRFLNNKTDRVDVVYTHYYSQGKQSPEIKTVIPYDIHVEEKYCSVIPVYDFYPDKEKLFNSLLPEAIRTEFFWIILSAVASEQIARRIAMKVATDAADEMIKMLTRFYNRARQTQITQEIAEIVRAIDAIE